MDGEYRTVRPELDLLYLLRSKFDGVETNESPSGTRKDFDLYFETDGVPIWVEVKAPDILDKVGGWFSTKAPVDHIWNNIRSEKFKEINELTSNDSVVIIGVWLEIPHVQEMLLSKEFNKAAPNWASHIDGMITFTSLGVLSFDVAYTPISASGWDVMDIFDKL